MAVSGSSPGRFSALAARLRLISGIILFLYALTHFLNHALGIRSLELMELGRIVFLSIWRPMPMTVLLYGALFIHTLLAMRAIYRRDRLRDIGRLEALQYVFGFILPIVLIEHILGTRGAHEIFGLDDNYHFTMLVMWELIPKFAWFQSIAMIGIWIHGCIGLHFWLRLKPGYQRWKPLMFVVAILVPVLGQLGFVDAGLHVRELFAADPSWGQEIIRRSNPMSNADYAQLVGLVERMQRGYVAVLVLVLLARLVRVTLRKRRNSVPITYESGETVQAPRGSTILEASRFAGLPHASVCGGRGRCSTCRVRIGEGLKSLPDPDEREQRVLDRVGLPPNVRLACQVRPNEPLEIARLMPPEGAGPGDAASRPGYLQGEEKEIAVLFADLRGFTKMSEHRLPYDVVFILNRYFSEMGQAVQDSGGRLDKFIGDGVMALFGVERGPGPGAQSALRAAKAMAENLESLNMSLANDLNEPLRIGIGIHIGPAIVGEMGYGHAVGLTAIGDTVNTSSRMEALTKEFGVQLVVSEAVAERADIDLTSYESSSISIRGRDEPVIARLVANAADLPI